MYTCLVGNDGFCRILHGVIDGKEKVNLSDLGLGAAGCQGNEAVTALQNYFKGQFGVDLNKNDVSTNTKSPLVTPSNS